MKVSDQDIGFQPEIINSILTKGNATSLKFSTSSLKHEAKDLSPRVKVDWAKIQEEEYISKESIQKDLLQLHADLLQLNAEQYKRYLNTLNRYSRGLTNLTNFSNSKAFDKFI